MATTGPIALARWVPDTPVPVQAKAKTVTGRLWTYVRDDKPFGGPAPPAALFYYSPDRMGVHPRRHLAGYGGISGSHRACAMGPDAGRRVCRVQ